MRCRLIIEEYCQKLSNIPGLNNVIADTLSRLPTMDEILAKNSLPMAYLKSTHVQKISMMNVR